MRTAWTCVDLFNSVRSSNVHSMYSAGVLGPAILCKHRFLCIDYVVKHFFFLLFFLFIYLFLMVHVICIS